MRSADDYPLERIFLAFSTAEVSGATEYACGICSEIASDVLSHFLHFKQVIVCEKVLHQGRGMKTVPCRLTYIIKGTISKDLESLSGPKDTYTKEFINASQLWLLFALTASLGAENEDWPYQYTHHPRMEIPIRV